MANFIWGLFIGCFFGLVIAGLCNASGRYDDQNEKNNSYKEKDIEQPYCEEVK